MGDYEHSATVATGPDVLFDYLSDVGNLPRYFAAMQSAEQVEGDAVHTVAEVDGVRREGEAWFTAEKESRTIRWGAEGPSDYAGELSVVGDDVGARVTVRLHTEHGEGEAVERGLKETVATIKRNVEAGADPVAPSPS